MTATDNVQQHASVENHLEEAQLGLAEAGWPTFPCNPANKAPLTRRGHKDATVDPEQIRAWRNQWPDASIGIAIPDNLIVIDVDPRNGGSDEALEHKLGSLPVTLKTISGRGDGGTHRWFIKPDTPLSAKQLPEGVDMKVGGRGYVIVPPSLHPATGQPYTWEMADIAELPAQAIEALQPPTATAPAPVEPPVDPSPLTEVGQILHPNFSSQDNDGLAPGADFEQRTDWADILIGWTKHHVDGNTTYWTRPGKPTDEGPSATTGYSDTGDRLYVFTTSTEFDTEVPYSKFGAYTELHHNGDHSAAASQLRKQGYGTPATNPASLQPTTDPTVDGVETVAPQTPRDLYPSLDWHAIWDQEIEEDWIVYPILPARRMVSIYSPPKQGKSLLMLEIAAAVATGKEVLGITLNQTRNVLYVDFENDPQQDIVVRLKAMGYTPDQLNQLHYLSFPNLPALDSEPGSQQLMAALEAYDCEVLVIDTVSRAIDGEENENDTWLRFYRHTGLKLKKAGIATVRLDHSGKDATKGQRGGSAKGGDVDSVWRLSTVSKDKTYQLECEMNRMAVAEKTLIIHRETEPLLRHRVDGAGAKAAFDAKVEEIITTLDDTDQANDIGRNDARDHLKNFSISASNNALAEAVRQRKARDGDFLV